MQPVNWDLVFGVLAQLCIIAVLEERADQVLLNRRYKRLRLFDVPRRFCRSLLYQPSRLEHGRNASGHD